MRRHGPLRGLAPKERKKGNHTAKYITKFDMCISCFRGSGEDYIRRSFMICTAHRILLG